VLVLPPEALFLEEEEEEDLVVFPWAWLPSFHTPMNVVPSLYLILPCDGDGGVFVYDTIVSNQQYGTT